MSRLRPYLILTLLWLIYFHPLVFHPGQVLYAPYSDFLAEHLPAKLFLNHEWRSSGELPLWNPYHFCGTPFVHDIQVGCFYPPYALVYLVPESAVGSAMSWVIALHLLAAGIFAFLHAREHGLGEIGALVAAAGFMLSAKWMTHLLVAGQTITIGLAWLPLLLLGLERGIRSGGVWPIIGAGVAFALLILGTHPQWTFYAGVFAAFWTLGPALERAGYLGGSGEKTRSRTIAAIGRWLVRGLGAVAIGVALSAVQLLPTWEASGLSARNVGVNDTGSLSVGYQTLFGLVGPSLIYKPPESWEPRGIFGLFWLTAALAAPLVGGRMIRWYMGVFLGLVLFSVGGAVLLEWLPGFRLFRLPGRMLLVATFPLAFLAGTATDAIIRSGWALPGRRALRMAFVVAAVCAVPSIACIGYTINGTPSGSMWIGSIIYWAVAMVSIPLLLFFIRPACAERSSVITGLWMAILALDLVTPSAGYPAVRPQGEIYPTSRLVESIIPSAHLGQYRVMDTDSGTGEQDKLAVMGVGSPLALVYRIETARGYNPLDVKYYRELIGFIANQGEPMIGLSPLAQPVIPDFPIDNRSLFDLLNVGVVICSNSSYPTSNVESWKRLDTDKAPPLVPAIPPMHPSAMPPQSAYQDMSYRARVLLVPAVERMPAGGELEALKHCDFRRTVLLTGDEPLPPSASGSVGKAKVAEYSPNRVTARVEGGGGGFLVLCDVWFPGWVCRVNGQETPIYRANHAFCAVAVPAGDSEVVFSFEPRSYRIGWWVSAGALGGVVVLGLMRLVVLAIRRRASTG